MKKNFQVLFLSSILALVISGCGSSTKTAGAASSPSLPTTLEEAVNSSYRTPKNKERDQYRHPVETLRFFGIKPEMTVVEISPGGGWYLEILAPYLAPQGQYIAAIFPENTDSSYMKELNTKLVNWLGQHPQLQEKTKLTAFAPPTHLEVAPEGSADMVLTFRNVHNWVSKDSGNEAFKAFYKALKPGGILGVVEHRAAAKSKLDPKAKSGYMREKEVIALAERAGFKLDAKSEINANPKDTGNHEKGVWTLPPSLRLKDKDREKYLAIGESDRMTLRFIKPAASNKK